MVADRRATAWTPLLVLCPFLSGSLEEVKCFEVTYQLSRILEGLFGKRYDVGDCHKLSLCSLPLERGGRAHRSRG